MQNKFTQLILWPLIGLLVGNQIFGDNNIAVQLANNFFYGLGWVVNIDYLYNAAMLTGLIGYIAPIKAIQLYLFKNDELETGLLTLKKIIWLFCMSVFSLAVMISSIIIILLLTPDYGWILYCWENATCFNLRKKYALYYKHSVKTFKILWHNSKNSNRSQNC